MKVIIRSPKSEDYDRFSNIMDQVQALHVEWRPDVYKPASPLITREVFEEILKEENWFVAEADGMVVGVLEIMVRHVESPSQVTKDILFISSMAVDQAYRGNGIGHLGCRLRHDSAALCWPLCDLRGLSPPPVRRDTWFPVHRCAGSRYPRRLSPFPAEASRSVP